MKQTYRRFCAVLLILCLLCGCAAEKEVTVISLSGEEKTAAEEKTASQAAPAAAHQARRGTGTRRSPRRP